MRRAWLALLLLGAAAAARADEPEVDWTDLLNTQVQTKGDAQTITYVPALKPLDGKPVTMHGWITPINLGDGTTVTSFLLTGTPGTCPFCFGMGPEAFVLVSAAEPVPADATVELLLHGRFELTPHDPIGFFYRLRQAHAQAVSP